jgi:hypothetical protein
MNGMQMKRRLPAQILERRLKESPDSRSGLGCHFQAGMGPCPCGYSRTNRAISDSKKSRDAVYTKVMAVRTPTCQAEHLPLLANELD